MTNGVWGTHRGDEWWYSDLFLEADAGFNQCPPALVIGELNVRGSTLSSDRLHEFLWKTMQQLPDTQIWLLLTPVTRPIIEALGATGQIRWESIKNPLSEEARVTYVSSPA